MMHRIFTREFFDMINTEYNKRGYFYRYFGWVNINFDPVAAKLVNLKVDNSGTYKGRYSNSGNISYTSREMNMIMQIKERLTLDPNTFEPGFPQLMIDSYKRVLNTIKIGSIIKYPIYDSTKLRANLNSSKTTDFTHSSRLSGINRYIGWSREMLEKAIVNSDLVLNTTDAILPNYPLTYIHLYNLSNIYISKSIIKPRLVGFLPGFRLRGRWLTPYMSNTYFAAIYRKIFGTITYVDWETICKNKLQKYDLLKFIAVNDFGLDYKRVRSLKYNQLCSVLTEESERKRQIRLELGEQVKRIIEPILYQPGSFLVPEPSGFAVKEEPKYIRPEWQELYNVCSNPDAVSKDELAFIARRMGVRKSLPKDLTNLTNNQICSTLINYVNLLQESKKHI